MKNSIILAIVIFIAICLLADKVIINRSSNFLGYEVANSSLSREQTRPKSNNIENIRSHKISSSLFTKDISHIMSMPADANLVKPRKKASNKNKASNLVAVTEDSVAVRAIESGVKESSSQNYIYISEALNNDVLRCALVSKKGWLTDCKLVLSNLSIPENMQVIGHSFYIVNYAKASMLGCGILADGQLESCTSYAIPFKRAAYIRYDNYALEISNINFDEMARCSLDANFIALLCNYMPPSIEQDLFIASFYKEYLYKAVYKSTYDRYVVVKCVGNNCTDINDANIKTPTTVRVFDHIAYVLNEDNLLACKIKPDGDFSACTTIKSNLNLPLGLAFYTS